MNIKQVVQAILLIWFVIINAAILIPSYQLLFGSDDAGKAGYPQLPSPPEPPPALSGVGPLDPNLEVAKQTQQVESYKQQVAAYAERVKGYTQEVTGYTQHIAAYKSYQEANEKSSRRGVYEVVVKNSLITLLGGFATTLLGLVFANLGAGVVDNMIRLRNNAQPEPLKLL